VNVEPVRSSAIREGDGDDDIIQGDVFVLKLVFVDLAGTHHLREKARG
jgi:hypothetical protein